MANEPPPGPLRRKTRLPFEQNPFGNTARQGAVVVYALLAIALAGIAVYMGAVEMRPLMSGYVAAPAIGAVWFGLRLFMILSKR